jgi:hypothetical protein
MLAGLCRALMSVPWTIPNLLLHDKARAAGQQARSPSKQAVRLLQQSGLSS